MFKHHLLVFTVEKIRQWIFVASNACLIALLVLILFQQSRIIIGLLKESTSSKVILNKPIMADIKTKKTSIAAWHLFGKEDIKISTTPPTQWILHGIILGAKGDDNLAIISSSNEAESIYQRGDKLADGTIISKIFADHVILTHQGKTESLYIPWNLQNPPIQSNTTDMPSNQGESFTLMKEP